MIAPDLWAVGAPTALEAGSRSAPAIAAITAKLQRRDILLINVLPDLTVPGCASHPTTGPLSPSRGRDGRTRGRRWRVCRRDTPRPRPLGRPQRPADLQTAQG